MKYLLLICVVLLYSCNAGSRDISMQNASEESNGQSIITQDSSARGYPINTQPGYLYVSFVDPFITTVLPVQCNSFEEMFKGQYTTIVLKVDESIFKQYSVDTIITIDVRAKIRYLHHGVVEIVCMDRFGSFFIPSKNIYAINPELSKLIFTNVPGWNIW